MFCEYNISCILFVIAVGALDETFTLNTSLIVSNVIVPESIPELLVTSLMLSLDNNAHLVLLLY